MREGGRHAANLHIVSNETVCNIIRLEAELRLVYFAASGTCNKLPNELRRRLLLLLLPLRVALQVASGMRHEASGKWQLEEAQAAKTKRTI